MKKILVVDDSALMRRVLCDIINADTGFKVADMAANGREALELLCRNRYDAVVLDVNMPEMNGLELLEELRRRGISARVMMASTATRAGAETTLRALELGALDFIHKPGAVNLKMEEFSQELLMMLEAVSEGRPPVVKAKAEKTAPAVKPEAEKKTAPVVKPEAEKKPRSVVEPQKFVKSSVSAGEKVVAIACSTGGPLALQIVLPALPGELDAPVLVVQHMPKGFTASLAARLDGMSRIRVKEAAEGEELQKGVAYIARGGLHMNVLRLPNGKNVIHYTDEPLREGVKPCANYTYESLGLSSFDEVVCVVLTGMGADGTAGIRSLKERKKIRVITQSRDTCIVYGMPKSIDTASLTDETVPLEHIAREITAIVGVR